MAKNGLLYCSTYIDEGHDLSFTTNKVAKEKKSMAAGLKLRFINKFTVILVSFVNGI